MIHGTVSAPIIPGLSAEHQGLVSALVGQIVAHAPRNRLRQRYYDYKTSLKELGDLSSIPPSVASAAETTVGWPAKAVDAMARRNILAGFDVPGVATADLGLDYLMERNGAAALIPQTHTSTLIHAVSFVSVTAGDVEAGEPEALILSRSAEWASGIWNPRTRTLDAALTIIRFEGDQILEMVLHRPNLAVVMRRDKGSRNWDIRQSVHDLGMPVEAIPYRPTLDRPFGHSRISRPVMSLTDAAVRTLLRTEVGAEFFNAPQRYALGVEPEAFGGKSGWEIMMGRLLALSRDEDGNTPQVGQFTQQSMEPNIAHYRMQAQVFAAETSLPLRSLGIVGDNPESEGAIKEANAELELELRYWQDASLTPAWRRIATGALRVLDDSPAARSLYMQLRPRWAEAWTLSTGARADAFSKLSSAIPGFAETTVGQRMAGFSDDQIENLQAELRRLQGPGLLERVIARSSGGGIEAT